MEPSIFATGLALQRTSGSLQLILPAIAPLFLISGVAAGTFLCLNFFSPRRKATRAPLISCPAANSQRPNEIQMRDLMPIHRTVVTDFNFRQSAFLALTWGSVEPIRRVSASCSL